MAIKELYAYLTVKNVEAAVAFYRDAFGASEIFRFVEPSGRIGHTEVRFGSAVLMISEEYPEYDLHGPQAGARLPVRLHLHVDDADATVAAAIAAGATLARPIKNEFYGERGGMVRDPFGYDWLIGHTVEALTPAEMQRRYTALFEPE